MGLKFESNKHTAVVPELGDGALRTSRAMFRRVLSTWAMDLVGLRSRGLDRPGPRSNDAGGLWSPPLDQTSQRRAA